MKVAVVSDDGKTVARDFGFARYFVVLSVLGVAVTDREVRTKAVDSRPAAVKVEGDPNDHFAGHRVGKGPRSRYDEMAAEIGDCEVVLARAFGVGARSALNGYGIEPAETTAVDVDEAALAYIAGIGSGRDHR